MSISGTFSTALTKYHIHMADAIVLNYEKITLMSKI